jgi:predicted alpha/beta-fold hydrolase
LNVKNYIDFDNLYTAKVFGFKDAEDYYRQTSSMNDLHLLNIPSLFMNSRDDRLSPIDSIDFEKVRVNKNLILMITAYGGHITWFKGLLPQSVRK